MPRRGTRPQLGSRSKSTPQPSCPAIPRCAGRSRHTAFRHDLLALGPSTATPLGSQVVVATAAIRNQFGSRLTSVYAPAVLASFGSGKARIDVRVIAPTGLPHTCPQFRADQQQRKSNGTALLTLRKHRASTPRPESSWPRAGRLAADSPARFPGPGVPARRCGVRRLRTGRHARACRSVPPP